LLSYLLVIVVLVALFTTVLGEEAASVNPRGSPVPKHRMGGSKQVGVGVGAATQDNPPAHLPPHLRHQMAQKNQLNEAQVPFTEEERHMPPHLREQARWERINPQQQQTNDINSVPSSPLQTEPVDPVAKELRTRFPRK